MNDEAFMEVIVQSILFLELSDEQTVDEDTAVAMMEQIAATLQRLEPSAMEQFLQYLGRRAMWTNTNEARQVIENMASNLGLVSE